MGKMRIYLDQRDGKMDWNGRWDGATYLLTGDQECAWVVSMLLLPCYQHVCWRKMSTYCSVPLSEDFALLEASYAIVRLLQSFPHIAPRGVEDASFGTAAASALDTGHSEKHQELPGSERQLLTLVLSCADGCWIKASRS